MSADALDVLFRSRARVKVLRRLVLSTQREFYQRELALLENLRVTAVKRELPRLALAGLVRRRTRRGRRFFRINSQHGLYRELKALFLKGMVFGGHLTRMKTIISKIDLVFVFGSFAKADEDEHSDLDVMIVSDLSGRELHELVDPKEYGFWTEFNSMHHSRESFRKALAEPGGFLERVLSEPVIYLLGGPHDVKRLGQEATAQEAAGFEGGPRQSP